MLTVIRHESAGKVKKVKFAESSIFLPATLQLSSTFLTSNASNQTVALIGKPSWGKSLLGSEVLPKKNARSLDLNAGTGRNQKVAHNEPSPFNRLCQALFGKNSISIFRDKQVSDYRQEVFQVKFKSVIDRKWKIIKSLLQSR